MRVRGKHFAAISFGLAATLVSAWSAKGQTNADIETQIKELESQVQKIETLKDQIEQLRSQQVEMKKEAVSAAAQMPSFDYRPGRGLTISGADKSWSMNTSARFNVYNYNVLGGKTNFNDGQERNSGTTFGELYPRRARVYTTFCWSDCFYQYEHSIDGESSVRDASFRDNEFTIGFNQLNPWLPYFSVGLRRGAGKTHVSRSSDNDGKVEHDIILDGFQWGGDGSHAGMGIGWDGVDIGPGEYELYLNYATSQQGTWQEFLPSDRKGLMMYIGGKPFSNMKSKWLSGLEMGFGYQGQSMDRAENFLNGEGVEIRVRTTERRGRQDLFRPAAKGQNVQPCIGDADACSAQNVGAGWAQVFIPGMRWNVGPYMFRFVYVTTRYANIDPGQGAGMWGRGFTIDNQVKLWSPKGFFTGSTTTPNSIIWSWGFERDDMGCGRGCDASPGAGSFHTQSVTLREMALWYWLAPSLGVGVWWDWWTTSNTPVRTQVGVGCKDSVAEASAGKGASRTCDFHSFNTGLRYRW